MRMDLWVELFRGLGWVCVAARLLISVYFGV